MTDAKDALVSIKEVVARCISNPRLAETICKLVWGHGECTWDKAQTILELTYLKDTNWMNAVRWMTPERRAEFVADWIVLQWIFQKQDHTGTEVPAWAMAANAVLLLDKVDRTVMEVVQELLLLLSDEKKGGSHC